MNLNPHRDLFHLELPPGCTWPAYMEVHLLRPFVISDLAFDPRPIRPTKNRSKPLECRVYPPRTALPRNFLIAASAHSGLSSCTTGWWCIALPPQCITDWLSEAPCISVNRRHNLVQSLAFLHKSTTTTPCHPCVIAFHKGPRLCALVAHINLWQSSTDDCYDFLWGLSMCSPTIESLLCVSFCEWGKMPRNVFLATLARLRQCLAMWGVPGSPACP